MTPPEIDDDADDRWSGIGSLLIGTAVMIEVLFFLTVMFVKATA